MSAIVSYALTACSGGGGTSAVPAPQAKGGGAAVPQSLAIDPNFGTATVLNAGYRVTLGSGGQLYYPSTAKVTLQTTKRGDYVAVNGRNAQDLFASKNVKALELRDAAGGAFKAYSAARRSPSMVGTPCDASQSSCGVCPDCSGPDAGPGGVDDQLNCDYLSICGYDPFGSRYYGSMVFGGIASRLGLDGFQCLWNADTGDLSCLFGQDGWEPPQFFDAYYYYHNVSDFTKPSCYFQVNPPPVHPTYLTFAGYKDLDLGSLDMRGRVYMTGANKNDLQTWQNCNPNSAVSSLYYNRLLLAGGAAAAPALP